MSASSQYYASVLSLNDIFRNIEKKFMESLHRKGKELADRFSNAAYLDIDYDTISRAVVINAGWPKSQDSEGWTETITKQASDSTIEIGVLNHESNSDPEDIQFNGFLLVLGQDTSPSTFPPNPLSSLSS
jgi:hypothetical protein